MTTYYYAGQITPNGVPHKPAGQAMFRRRVDVPALIANGGLVDSSGNALALPSTGFAQNDILKVFAVGKGTLVKSGAVYLATAEGATCTIDVGVQSSTQTDTGLDVDGWFDGIDMNASAGTFYSTVDDAGFGTDNYPGVLYITDGHIDILWMTSADNETVVFDIAFDGVEMFPNA
jgi:hypothetical protein